MSALCHKQTYALDQKKALGRFILRLLTAAQSPNSRVVSAQYGGAPGRQSPFCAGRWQIRPPIPPKAPSACCKTFATENGHARVGSKCPFRANRVLTRRSKSTASLPSPMLINCTQTELDAT